MVPLLPCSCPLKQYEREAMDGAWHGNSHININGTKGFFSTLFFTSVITCKKLKF
jgi:hypothetical protein